nr:MAG TPA: hypothetical protein [Caudoviricetes sp.]
MPPMMFLGEFRTSPVLQPLLYHYIIYREKCNYYNASYDVFRRVSDITRFAAVVISLYYI